MGIRTSNGGDFGFDGLEKIDEACSECYIRVIQCSKFLTGDENVVHVDFGANRAVSKLAA